MSPAGAVTLAALLVAVFLLVVGVLAWQESKRRPGGAEPAYVVEEAVAHIMSRLEDDIRPRLGGGGVRRIIEWELHYLQGLAQKQRWRPVETVAGGIDPSIDYIVDRIATVHGVTYDRGDVAEVLRLEADYLFSIGVVGDPVDMDEYERDDGGDEA